MEHANPYAGLRCEADRPARPGLSARKAFAIVLGTGFSFTVIGAGLGYLLAILAPGYYRGVFDGGRDPGFDPVQVGMGLGLTQGMICGILVGAVVTLAVAISHRRTES